MNDIYTMSMIVSISTFILITHITPGPTNVILLSSVLNYGYKKSFPFMLANIISYPLLMVFTAFGIGMFLIQHHNIMLMLKIIGLVYLSWMAWKIFNDSTSYENGESVKTKPYSFLQGLVYPWLNPKAWVVYSSIITVFVTSIEKSSQQFSFIIFLIFIAMIITVGVWSIGGILLKRFLKNKEVLKRINQTMAILLICSIIPILF